MSRAAQINHARRATLFVLALWGRYLPVRDDGDGTLPILRDDRIVLPRAWKSRPRIHLLYRAAACHAAAHALHAGEPLEAERLRPRQLALINLIEDARVEALASRECPGLRALWRSFLPAELPDTRAFPALMRRLARALLCPQITDTNAWVRKGAQRFHEDPARWLTVGFARELGLALAHDLGQMRIAMDDGKPFQVLAYHDDNRHLWVRRENCVAEADTLQADAPIAEAGAFLQEADSGRRLALADRAGADATDAWHLRELPRDAVLEYRHHAEPLVNAAWSYPEWDYRLDLPRAEWCRVHERPMPPGSPVWVREVLRERRSVLRRLQRIAQALRLEKVQRARQQQDGDELDINAALRAVTDLRAGCEPDLRVHYRIRPLHDRGLASLLLLDLSESGNAVPAGAEHSVIELARQAALLLGHALDNLDERFAIDGFSSCGRQQVDYFPVKDFVDSFDAATQARIAGMRCRHSTRLGTALRHARSRLLAEAVQRKLLLVVTDGDPADIDVYDPVYLERDARHAVQECLRAGVQVFCLCLDPGAQVRVQRMFGTRRYRVLDDIERLPALLPEMLLALLRRY